MAVMQLRLLCVGAALAAGDGTACQIRLASQASLRFSPHNKRPP